MPDNKVYGPKNPATGVRVYSAPFARPQGLTMAQTRHSRVTGEHPFYAKGLTIPGPRAGRTRNKPNMPGGKSRAHKWKKRRIPVFAMVSKKLTWGQICKQREQMELAAVEADIAAKKFQHGLEVARTNVAIKQVRVKAATSLLDLAEQFAGHFQY